MRVTAKGDAGLSIFGSRWSPKHLTGFSQSCAPAIASNQYDFPVTQQGVEVKLNLETQTVGSVVVLSCTGRFTYREEATAFSEKIAELLPSVRQVVVELSGLEALDSAGLGELVVVHMWAKASGCSMKLAGASPRIRQLFELTNLISVFEVHSTLDDALLSFQRPVARAKTADQVA
jgi:anti-sigma B factor antagonist